MKFKTTTMEKVIITTTNSIEGATVDKYLGVVTTNLVIGTNFFSDFTASLSDFFGGMSGTYQKQMDTLYKRANEEISRKATERGANCILGFKIDFDEISGKGKSMFMISVSGTAVRIKQDNRDEQDIQNRYISSESVEIEMFKHDWANRGKWELPTEADWSFIRKYNLTELAPSLYEYYQQIYDNPEYKMQQEYFKQFISEMDYNNACDVLYSDYDSNGKFSTPLIKANRLFNPEKVLGLAKDGVNVIPLLTAEKPEYTGSDIRTMIEIAGFFDSLPDKGHFEMVKTGVLPSKMKEMYICPDGHKNEKDTNFCYECGKNMKGLNINQVKIIENFKIKVNILNNLINK